MKELFVFIDTNWEVKKFILNAWKKAILVYSKYFSLEKKYEIITVNDFDKYCHIIRETRPKWGVTKQKFEKIFIYNPIAWTEKETGHKPADIVSSIVHQLFHVYCYNHKLELPKWLEEGIATYLSQDFDGGQKDKDFLKLKKQNTEIPDLPNLNNDFSSHKDHSWSYLSAYTFIKYLIKTEGRQYIKRIPTEYQNKNKLFNNNILLKWKQFLKEQYV